MERNAVERRDTAVSAEIEGESPRNVTSRELERGAGDSGSYSDTKLAVVIAAILEFRR